MRKNVIKSISEDALSHSLRRLTDQVGSLVDAVDARLDWDRHNQAFPDFVLQDQISLVRDFVAERLERTGRESDVLSVRTMFREYRNWCYDRSLREDETLPFTGVMKALGSMGFVRTGEPLIMLAQSVWPEYAFTGVKINEHH